MPKKPKSPSLYDRLYGRLSAIRKLEIEAVMFVAVIVVGMVAFHHIEKWDYLDAAYFTTATLSTVGYGDLTPKTHTGKAVSMVYHLIGIPLYLYMASLLFNRRYEEHEKWLKRRFFEIEDEIGNLKDDLGDIRDSGRRGGR